MQTALKVQLSTFMFLQYYIWGSWYASMGAYLANALRFDGQQIGAAYGAFAIGSMISPFFVGLIADRYFASEKMLGVLPKFTDDMAHRIEFFRNVFPRDYVALKGNMDESRSFMARVAA